jgi:hypothetical protein
MFATSPTPKPSKTPEREDEKCDGLRGRLDPRCNENRTQRPTPCPPGGGNGGNCQTTTPPPGRDDFCEQNPDSPLCSRNRNPDEGEDQDSDQPENDQPIAPRQQSQPLTVQGRSRT